MILTQTIALFVDAYRELNAKKLFWITMGLSLFVVLIFAAIGINAQGITFFGMKLSFLPLTTSLIPKDVFYLQLFSSLGIGLWLTWIATILALISTSSIIPDLISGGVIETTLSKPISRLRLFLTKYTTGLIFVALQVGVFTLASFLVIGVRGQIWEARLFLAIPIVLAFFSYLYAVSAFVGMITKAAMPAILVTCLFWTMLFVINIADNALVGIGTSMQLMQEARQEKIEQIESNTSRLIISEMERNEPGSGEGYEPTDDEIDARNSFLPMMRTDLEEDEKGIKQLKLWTNIVVGIKTVLPKTQETSALLERTLIDPEKIPVPEVDEGQNNPMDLQVDQTELSRRVEDIYRSRSLWWILGTSFIFEGVLLLFCCWRFTRRDF